VFSYVFIARTDATLKELMSLVKEVNVDARKKGTYFDFAIVTPENRTPIYRMNEIGSTCAGMKGKDDNVTLANKRFQIGDYLDIAITPPQRGPPPGRRGRPY
jgi:histone deacetylase complex subunit SAP18